MTATQTVILAALAGAVGGAFGACSLPRAQQDAARVQHEDGERGCALPGKVLTTACNGDGCLVCYEVAAVPSAEQRIPNPSVCLSFSVGGCE